jgi:hypothetical protein
LGYCLITDLQWRLKTSMGEPIPASGYVKFLADRVFRADFDPDRVNRITYTTTAAAAVLSAVLTTTVGVC